MAPTNINALLSSMGRNFIRFQHELDTLPPVLFNDRKIKAHAGDGLIDACDVIAHATGWTNTATTWIERLRDGKPLLQPTADHQWSELDRLSADFYRAYNTAPFKELRAPLTESNSRLTALLKETDPQLLFKVKAPCTTTLAALLHLHISTLYETEVVRLRTWKKGLGWI